MIRSIAIHGLRGIQKGQLDDLTPIVVLVGPNSAGKSTILDALFLAASAVPEQALQLVGLRRPTLQPPHRWLLWREGTQSSDKAVIEIASDDPQPRKIEIANAQIGNPNSGLIIGKYSGSPVRAPGGIPLPPPPPPKDIQSVRLVDPDSIAEKTPLADLYSRVAELGLRKEAKEIITDLLPEIEDIEILTQQNQPVVYLVYKTGALPIGTAGDGVRLLLRQSLELAASVGGLILLEEPELHMHPGAIQQSAKAMLAAMRRKIQIVVTTHSLDLIDALLANAAENEMDCLSFYRLQLDHGQLLSHRSSGREAAVTRTQIEEDLR